MHPICVVQGRIQAYAIHGQVQQTFQTIAHYKRLRWQIGNSWRSSTLSIVWAVETASLSREEVELAHRASSFQLEPAEAAEQLREIARPFRAKEWERAQQMKLYWDGVLLVLLMVDLVLLPFLAFGLVDPTRRFSWMLWLCIEAFFTIDFLLCLFPLRPVNGEEGAVLQRTLDRRYVRHRMAIESIALSRWIWFFLPATHQFRR